MEGLNTSKINCTCLPAESLLNILQYLDYRDLVSCIKACQRLRTIADDDVLWRQQCKFWFLQTECQEGLSWKQQFEQLFKEFGHNIHCYKQIKKAWSQIEKYMREKCPHIWATVQGPVSEQELDETERALDCQFPPDFRMSYRLHNGQEFARNAHGLMGSSKVSGHFRSDKLLSLELMTKNHQDDELPDCIPLTLCATSHSIQFICVSSGRGIEPGTIFYPTPNNLDGDRTDFFISGRTFTEWICTYAQDLEDNLYSLIDGNVFKFYHEPSCVAVTDGIFTVKAASCFMPEQSTVNPPHFFFAYRITMSMDKNANPYHSCQLVTRHWIITDEDGREEVVHGPGVVGEFPVMRPGAEYSWISCTKFSTTYGNMKGYFKMKNLKTGSSIDIQCPVYHMKCHPYITSEECFEEIQAGRRQIINETEEILSNIDRLDANTR
ncbi:hypothetical protein CHS0354_002734 [Potamilus streckersoni]|uniref:F-box protein 3 n=1 Tax=Potamilus streckersoni TaxID=2493646 RepID=A0AAE0VXU5_9BIVA|nr:hypothetical protein CHS0354_002734 [Potamilus streckersoni]